LKSVCVIGVGGASNTGKTTLIEKALPELKRQGLAVGVLKHTHHSIDIDSENKDTARFYRAGADFVCANDNQQGFARYPQKQADIFNALERFPRSLDLILVEGYKDASIPKIHIATGTSRETGHAGDTVLLRKEDQGNYEIFLEYIHTQMNAFCSKRQIRAGLLIGGKSKRMGRTKALLEINGITLVERSFAALSKVAKKTVLLGKTDLPKSLQKVDMLPDIDGLAGPLSGMLSAFRWAPDSTWIISAVDMPFMHEDAWNWLLRQRRPGVWAILPRIKGKQYVETTGACYEPMLFDFVESIRSTGVSRIQKIKEHPKVITPEIPESISSSWSNINTVDEWKQALSSSD
jgi:molybdopterin-guanine dinucleotide biosynthesis protein MobB